MFKVRAQEQLGDMEAMADIRPAVVKRWPQEKLDGVEILGHVADLGFVEDEAEAKLLSFAAEHYMVTLNTYFSFLLFTASSCTYFRFLLL